MTSQRETQSNGNGPSMIERAQEVTASANWELHPRFPFVMDHASGVHVWDCEGKRYTDFTSCSGAAPLGAGFKHVLDRTVEELYRTGGILAGPLSTLRVELAERLRSIFPRAERTIFFRTGSCATTAAVRLARIFSDRRTIFTSGFHGWHDWHLQYRPHLALSDRDPDTVDFAYDLDRLSQLFCAFSDVAAVIVTPEVNFFPPQFMAEVEKITHENGALLVIDEVMTGFRYAAGGYHGACGIRPDLVTISKGLANGVALSAVLGRADVIQAQERTYLGNTYQREVTPFAAALATLDVYQDGEPIDQIRAMGAALMDGLNSIFNEKSVAARALSMPSMFDVVFEDATLGERFFREMWSRGFLMQYGGRFMPSAATASRDIEEALEAASQAIDTVMSPGDLDSIRPPSRDAGRRVPTLAALTAFAAENFGASDATTQRWASI